MVMILSHRQPTVVKAEMLGDSEPFINFYGYTYMQSSNMPYTYHTVPTTTSREPGKILEWEIEDVISSYFQRLTEHTEQAKDEII